MTRIPRYLVAALAAALCALALAACTAPQASTDGGADDPVAANRQYMSSLAQMSDELGLELEGFSDAASRNDTVSMRVQADNAYEVIDRMRDQEAPEDLTDLKDGYMEACDGLEDALDSYIALYEDVSSASVPMDAAAYAQRVKDIQDKYTAAVDKLQETDTKATELQK